MAARTSNYSRVIDPFDFKGGLVGLATEIPNLVQYR